MKVRSPAAVFFLPIITLGIYAIYWYVATKNDLNKLVEPKVPTAWLLIVPIAGWIWIWKFAGSVSSYTKGASSQGTTFILLFLLGGIGQAIAQSNINKTAA